MNSWGSSYSKSISLPFLLKQSSIHWHSLNLFNLLKVGWRLLPPLQQFDQFSQLQTLNLIGLLPHRVTTFYLCYKLIMPPFIRVDRELWHHQDLSKRPSRLILLHRWLHHECSNRYQFAHLLVASRQLILPSLQLLFQQIILLPFQLFHQQVSLQH